MSIDSLLRDYKMKHVQLEEATRIIKVYETSLKKLNDSINKTFEKEFKRFIEPINEKLPEEQRITQWSVNYHPFFNQIRIAIKEIGGKEVNESKLYEEELPLPEYLKEIEGFKKRYSLPIHIFLHNNIEIFE